MRVHQALLGVGGARDGHYDKLSSLTAARPMKLD
jgi:hypothetical protein